MEKLINFREFSIYTTKEGKPLKRGLLFRSGNLSHASEKDKKALQDLNIGYIVDLRDDYEVAANPDPIIDGIQNMHQVASKVDMVLLKASTKESQIELIENMHPDIMIDTYKKLPFDNAAYKTYFDLILQQEDRSILHHCSAGKDRAGVLAALMLLLLQVDEEVVIQDYLLSSNAFDAIEEDIIRHVPEDVKAYVKQKLRPMFLADRSYLEASLSAIKEKYQTYEEFFEKEYGIDDYKREQIYRRYID